MEPFIAHSPHSVKALNTLRVAAELPVNILVVGEEGSGKRALIQTVFPSLKIVEASDALIDEAKELGLVELEKIEEPKRFLQKFQDQRIIATSKELYPDYEEFFPVIIELPPLKERLEDAKVLMKRYKEQIEDEFGFKLESENSDFDLTNNKTLKRSILLEAMKSSLEEKELFSLMEHYLKPRLEEGYKSLLYLFDIPFFKAAKKRYRSVLAISKAVKLNRATVQTKMKRCGLLKDKG